MVKKASKLNSDTVTSLDRNQPPLICPHCGDVRIIYKSKASLWECENCEERFSGGIPESRIRRLDDKAERPKEIFFSYGHDSNRDLVQLFKNDLEKRGHQIWFDEKDIGDWDDWKGKITRGIDSSQLAIAFMSKHSIRDPGVCRNEIAIAMNRFGTVYPVLLEAGIEKDIPITIRHLQWPDLSQWKLIRDGSVPGTEWVRWYEDRLLSLIEKIEGDASQFAEETDVLERVLNPITAESKIVQHVPTFIGREWIFDAYRDWVDQQPDSRLFWIKAGPGVGKSAIAANLIHRERSAIVAGWFCDAKSSERKDPNKAIRSIAFQLALRWEDYRIRLLRKLQLFAHARDELCEEARKKLENKTTHDLFTLILAEPMTGLIWRDHKLVIVIDALDEAKDEKGNNRITELISNELNSLPPWIGFVVTSRPEADVVNQLHGFKPFEIDTSDSRNLADLKNWYCQHLGLIDELQTLPIPEQKHIENILIDRSGGMILYLKVIEEGFKEGSLTVANLLELESGLPGLYRRYYDSFLKRFQDDYEDSIKPLLRLLLAAGGPLPKDLACETLGWNSEQFMACRDLLGSYVIENVNGYELFHKTLAEWLSDQSSGPFHLDKLVGRQMLAYVLFEELEKKEFHLMRWRESVSEWLLDWIPQLSKHSNFSLIYLAQFFHYWGNFAISELLYQRDLEITDKTFGSDHAETGIRLNNLAIFFYDCLAYDKAEPLFRRSLAISEKSLGSEHPEISTNLSNLGSLLSDMGNHTEAELLLRRALTITEKSFGSEHAETHNKLNNLGMLFSTIEDQQTAEPILRRALAIAEKSLGPEHPATAESLNNLASLLSDMGNHTEAELLIRRALAIAEKVLGYYHPRTALYLDNLGCLLGDKGNFTEAEPLHRRALAIDEKSYGSDHPLTAVRLCTFGSILNERGNHTEAELLIRRALEILKETPGRTLNLALSGLQNLAVSLRDEGDIVPAEAILLEVIESFSLIEGSESLGLASAYSAMGKLMSLKGDILNSEVYYRKALDIREAQLGENDELTTLVRSRLNELLMDNS